MPTVYHYDSQGVFVCATSARKDPLESAKQGFDTFLLPANATFVAVPEGVLPEHTKYRWVGSWETVEDYRGLHIFQQVEPYQVVYVETVGAIPAGYALTPPEIPQE